MTKRKPKRKRKPKQEPAPYGQGDEEDLELTALEGIIRKSGRRKP